MVELYEPVAEEAGVDLQLEDAGPIMVRANRELISQALANLVDNAIKYADEGNEQAGGRDLGQRRRKVS